MVTTPQDRKAKAAKAQKWEQPDNEPLHFSTTEHADDEVEMVTLFTIDDTEYQIPAKPKAVIGLRFMNDLRTIGQTMAVSNMLVALLGSDGWLALCNFEDLEIKDMERIIGIAQKIVFGELNAVSGN